MRQTGIWLDWNDAYIFHINDGSISKKRIKSNIEHYNVKGGSRSKTPYGPMENTSESKALARKKQQNTDYFERLLNETSQSQELLIMGPAEAKIAFRDFYKSVNRSKAELLGVLTMDSITENQMQAHVRNFYGAFAH